MKKGDNSAFKDQSREMHGMWQLYVSMLVCT